jgi:hypothetical protein
MKNALISGLIGLLFMAGGFAVGFKMMPKPKAAPVVVAPPTTVTPPGAAVPVPAPDAISMDTLKKTSESMMALNLALADREKRVAEREAAVKEKEDELVAERTALDASHEKFKALFNDFQSRLQLVEASQQEQLQKQADLYSAMGPAQSIELIRTMDDNAMTRLFSVMDTKPLAKLVSAWKTKYPEDSPRLLRTLTNTAQVMDKDKMALNDPLSGNAAPVDTSAPAPAPEAPAPDAPAPAAAPPTDSAAPAPDSTTPNTAPAPLAPPADAPSPANPPSAAPASPPATTDGSSPSTDPAATAPALQPDVTIPGATAEALAPHPATAATVPAAQPAAPSDLGVDATDLHPRRAKPVNITTATTD